MARGLIILILLSLSCSTLALRPRPASVKLVVHNVADRTITFTCAELGKSAKPVVAEKGHWTAIGPIEVFVESNAFLHLTVTVGTGKRYGVVRKSMVINLMKHFQSKLEGSKFLVLTAIENARERTLKIKVEKRVALSFNLY